MPVQNQYGGFLGNPVAMQAIINALAGPTAPRTPTRKNTKGKNKKR
jgi:hypothetical protein